MSENPLPASLSFPLSPFLVLSSPSFEHSSLIAFLFPVSLLLTPSLSAVPDSYLPLTPLRIADLSLSRQSLATTHFSGAGFGPMAVNPNASYGLGGPGSLVGPSSLGVLVPRWASLGRPRSVGTGGDTGPSPGNGPVRASVTLGPRTPSPAMTQTAGLIMTWTSTSPGTPHAAVWCNCRDPGTLTLFRTSSKYILFLVQL